MMSGLRRFFSLDQEVSKFVFTIDTRNIVTDATNGSENPLTFRLPIAHNNINNSFLIKVSDGRPDISITSGSSLSAFTLSFSSSGVYQIKIIGRVGIFSFNGSYSGNSYGYDKLKIISIDNWGSEVGWSTTGVFDGCSNLVIKANNTLLLPVDSNDMFRGIKEFQTSLLLLDSSRCTTAQRIIAGVTTTLQSTLNPFWRSIVSFSSVYNGNTFNYDVDRIEIISDTLESFRDPWGAVTFQNTGNIRLICKTPNLKTIFRIYRNGQVRTRCHLGEVDVRSVNNTESWANGGMTPAQVDPTLLGWANNLPYMQSGVTWNWGGSKYSNNPAVIAALNKITNEWGVIFTNLTMI